MNRTPRELYDVAIAQRKKALAEGRDPLAEPFQLTFTEWISLCDRPGLLAGSALSGDLTKFCGRTMERTT